MSFYFALSKIYIQLNSDDDEGEEREFLFLSDVVPEDKELRKQLQMDRLEFVLQVQEEERRNENFKRGCLFCRQEFTSAAELLSHMAFDHNFNIGQADNIVFIEEFLDKIDQKLEQLVCLYCEKLFKSREVLKEHMRKKMHKKLNPKNKEWDKYYLVNYLEFGKTWEDFSKEESYRTEEELPSGWDEAEREGNEDSEWNDWRGETSQSSLISIVFPLQTIWEVPSAFSVQQTTKTSPSSWNT